MKKQNKNCEKKQLLQVDSIKYLFSNTILMIKQTDFFFHRRKSDKISPRKGKKLKISNNQMI